MTFVTLQFRALHHLCVMKTMALPSHTYSWDAWFHFVEQLVSEHQTSGNERTEARIEFTRLNLSRMKRVYKTFQANETLQAAIAALPPMQWLLITEAWCGDGAQALPVIARMAEYNPHISLHIVLRDENPELMDQFLTNGARAIPVLVMLHAETLEPLARWGARPASLAEKVRQIKAEGATHDEISLAAQEWYNADKGQAIAAEILQLAQTAMS